MNNIEKTAEQKLAEFVAGDDGQDGGRKLKFHEQCQIFALLYGGMKNRFVAHAFGLSATTVSNIGGCLEYDPYPYQRRLDKRLNEVTVERDHNQGRNPNRARRYEEVAREFEALGVEEFNHRYLTHEVLDRVERAKAQLRALGPAPPPLLALANMAGEFKKMFHEIARRGPTEDRITTVDNYLHMFKTKWDKYAEENSP